MTHELHAEDIHPCPPVAAFSYAGASTTHTLQEPPPACFQPSAITDDSHQAALLSTRNRPRTAMHLGCVACANYIRELTGSHEADCPPTVSDQVAGVTTRHRARPAGRAIGEGFRWRFDLADRKPGERPRDDAGEQGKLEPRDQRGASARRDACFAVTPSHRNQVGPMITTRSLNIGLVSRVDLRNVLRAGRRRAARPGRCG